MADPEIDTVYHRGSTVDTVGGGPQDRTRGVWPKLCAYIFHTVFASVYHYAISELCKGLYHHNGEQWGLTHESTRTQIHRFQTGFDHISGASAAAWSMPSSDLTNAAATVRSVGAV